MKKTTILLAVIFYATLSFAQTKFKPGTITLASGETIEGFIADQKELTSTVEFKKTEASEIASYSVNDVKTVKVFNRRQFITIPASKFRNQYGNVFCELIVTGDISLIIFEENFYVAKGDSVFHKIEVLITEKYVDGVRYEVKSTTHKGILHALMSDCKETRSKIDAMSTVTERTLTNLVTAYNKCAGGSYDEVKDGQAFTKLDLSLVLGFAHENFQFKADLALEYEYPQLYSTNPMTNHPILGLDFNVFSPRVNENVFFNARVLLSKESFKDEIVRSLGFVYPRTFKVQFDQYRLRIPLGVMFKFGHTATKPYIRSGASYSLLLNHSSQANSIYTDSAGNNYNVDILMYNLKMSVVGLWIGGGTSFKIGNQRFFTDIEYRFDFLSYESKNRVNQGDIKSLALSFNLGYTF